MPRDVLFCTGIVFCPGTVLLTPADIQSRLAASGAKALIVHADKAPMLDTVNAKMKSSQNVYILCMHCRSLQTFKKISRKLLLVAQVPGKCNAYMYCDIIVTITKVLILQGLAGIPRTDGKIKC